MFNKQTLAAALNTFVFVIVEKGNAADIEKITWYEHVTASAEKVTSPRGVEPKIFVEETEDGKWGLFQWLGGTKRTPINEYNTEDEARDEWFSRIYVFDFLEDDQRDTSWFATEADAIAEWGVRAEQKDTECNEDLF